MNAPTVFIAKGDYAVIDDVHHLVLSRDGHGATMQSTAPPRITLTKTHEELRILYFEQRLRIVRAGVEALPSFVQANLERSLDQFKPAAVATALARLEYCQAMQRFYARGIVSKTDAGYGRVVRVVARYRRLRSIAVDGKRPNTVPLESFHWGTLRNWMNLWIKGGCIQALIPGDDQKGRTQQDLDPEVVLVIADRISNNWLTLESPPFTLVYDLIVADIEGLNVGRAIPLPIPSEDVCRSWRDRNVSEYEEVYYRDGQRKAQQKYGRVRRAPQATRPLEIVEIDHTPLDILLVHKDGSPNEGDRRKRKKTHRVWLTVALCTTSRMIVGWHISPDRPSWTAVMTCLRMGILPKDFADKGCRSPHPVFGVPEVLKLDNGKEFHSRSLKAAAAQLRTELRWTPRRKPHLKGKVERVIGTINRDYLAFLAGRTFRDVRERGDYPSERRATFTLEEINRLFARWVVDIYHNRPHYGLMGRTPLQRWDDLSGFGVRLPPTAAELFAILALVVERTVTREGVTFLGLTYHSDAIVTMRRRLGHHLGRMYMVKVDPLDLGQVLVLDEEKGRWLEVPCEYPELAEGVSLAQWRANVALARKMTREGSRVSLEILRAARKEIAEEAARRGAKPIRMTQDEVDWYRDHVDDSFFDVVRTVGTEEENRLRAEERQRRRGKPPSPDAAAPEPPPAPPRVGGGPAAADPVVGADDDDDDDNLTAIID